MRSFFLTCFLISIPVYLIAVSYDSGQGNSLTSSSDLTLDDLTVDVLTSATVSNSGRITTSSVTVQNQFLMGTGDAISTFTATAFTIDNGVTMTNQGVTTLNGAMNFGNAITDVITVNALLTIPSNAAPRSNVTPTAIGQLIVNTGSSPDQVCISTGTLISQWARIADFAVACSN